MFATIEDVPDGHRGKFYPPIVIEMDVSSIGELRPDFMSAHKALIDKMNMQFFLGIFGGNREKSEDEKLLERLKYAYINEGDKRYITFVDNETMKAYRLHNDSYYDGLVFPLTEVENFTFDRWCRGMDL